MGNVNDYGTEEFDNVCALDVLYQNNLVRQIVNNQTAIADHEQRIGALESSSGGTQLYKHTITFEDEVVIYITTTKNTQFQDNEDLIENASLVISILLTGGMDSDRQLCTGSYFRWGDSVFWCGPRDWR